MIAQTDALRAFSYYQAASLTFVLWKLFIALAFLCSCLSGARAGAKAQSTSISRQFIVYGTDVQVRGAICDLAEETKSNLLKTLALRDAWKTPLVIKLDYPQANLPEVPPARLDFSRIESGFKLQLNLLVGNDLNRREVQRELLRAILIERIYRERTSVAVGTRYAAPPDWLVDGILQLGSGRGTEEVGPLLETMVALGKIMPVEEIVRQRRELLEPASRRMHDACALALVQLLIDAPRGREKLAGFIDDLADAPNDSMADLRAHFPALLGRSSGKWWALSVARLSASNRYQLLSSAETAQQLDRLLRLTLAGPDGRTREYGLGEYAAYSRVPASRGALLHLSQRLLLLSARANPRYDTIVQEAYDLTRLLARGKTRRVTERLARVASARVSIEGQGHEIDDYLNWFEATQLRTMSGAFSEILKSASETETAPARRRDPISVYLDSIEASL